MGVHSIFMFGKMQHLVGMLTEATGVNRPEIGLWAGVLTSNVTHTSGAASTYVQGKWLSYINRKRNRSLWRKKPRNSWNIFQVKPEQVQNKISKVSPSSVINSVRRTRLFTRADLDKESQTGSSGAMEGPEPRRENPVLFHKHLVEKKGKRKSLTTKEALCLRLFQLRVLARTDPLRAQAGWKERKRKGSFIWLTTSTNQYGGRMCVIWLYLFCIRI